MRTEARTAIIRRMTDMRARDPIRLVIDLDRGAEPIEGRLTAADGHDVPFRGWLSLTTLIESARNVAVDDSGGRLSGGPALDRPGL